jgi:hypothetical protein
MSIADENKEKISGIQINSNHIIEGFLYEKKGLHCWGHTRTLKTHGV